MPRTPSLHATSLHAPSLHTTSLHTPTLRALLPILALCCGLLSSCGGGGGGGGGVPPAQSLADLSLQHSLFPTGVVRTGDEPTATQLTDLDNDGRLDAVVVTRDQSVFVHRGTGEGQFFAPKISSAAMPAAQIEFALGDVDADGARDILLLDTLLSRITVRFGDGTGLFAPGVTTLIAADPRSIAVADLDGDGHLDAVTAHAFTSRISIHFGNGDGDGTFVAAAPILLASAAHSLVLADLDDDGDLDLAVTHPQAGEVSIFLGNSTGAFVANGSFTAGVDPRRLSVADLEGDGDLDLVIANFSGTAVTVAPGTGSGTFLPLPPIALAGPVEDIALTDLDGDDQVDIVAAHPESPFTEILLGLGGGAFAAPTIFEQEAPAGASQETHRISAGDLDGDAVPDLVRTSGALLVGLGAGDGTFPSVVPTRTTVGEEVFPTDTALGDVNGDGFLDAVVTGIQSGDVRVLLGAGDGSFAPPLIVASGKFPSQVELADFDGDQQLDLCALLPGTEMIEVSLGFGDGTFAAPLPHPAGSSPLHFRVTDLQNDGNPDVFVLEWFSNQVTILTGLGNGAFSTSSLLTTDEIQDFAIGDLDQNGFPDVVLTTLRYPIATSIPIVEAQILLGDGSGFLVSADPLPLPPLAALALGDFDADGALDLYVEDPESGAHQLRFGNGNGTFQGAIATNGNDGESVVAAEDLNGDGFFDLISQPNPSGFVVSLGHGTGQFTRSTAYGSSLAPGFTSSLDFRDLDGDGDLDAVQTLPSIQAIQVDLNRLEE